MAARVDLAVDCRSVLGESPIWCGKEKRLYWIDINGRTLSAYEPAVQQMPCLPVVLPALVGTIVPRAGGNLLACLEEDIVPVNADTRVVGLPVASVPQEHRGPGMRFNDGKCDLQGRLWVGTMHSSWRDPKAQAGRLYCVRASTPAVSFAVEPEYLMHSSYALMGFSLLTKGRVSTRVTAITSLASSGLMVASLAARSTARATPSGLQVKAVIPSARLPNGMTWSADGRTMYWIDTATNCVDAFDFDPGAGALSNRRTVVTCPRQGASVHGAVGGVPDGMTIDSDGKLWVVLGESGCVVQYDPATGRQVSAVALPVQRPTACTFGGADLSELYVTTREEGTGPKASANAGGLFRVRVPGVRGLAPAYEFAG